MRDSSEVASTPAPIGIAEVLALGERFVGEKLRVAVYANATPAVRDLSAATWLGIGMAEGALGIAVPGGLLGDMAVVPIVERIRRKTARQKVGVERLRGVVGLYCTATDLVVAALQFRNERPRIPRLSRIALRVGLDSVHAYAYQNAGLDWLHIDVASLEAPLTFSTRAGTNYFPEVAAWLRSDGSGSSSRADPTDG